MPRILNIPRSLTIIINKIRARDGKSTASVEAYRIEDIVVRAYS